MSYPEPPAVPLTVKDWDPELQPREKALKYGIDTLSKPELLSIIMRTGQKGIPVTDVCASLLKRCGDSFSNLAKMSHREICLEKGIGRVKGLEIMAIMEIGRRMAREDIGERPLIRSSKDIFDLMRYDIGTLPHEEIHLIFLNRGNRVTEVRKMTQGSATASLFDLKMFLKEALLANAQGVIMCHNHPSGQRRPSPEDDNITRRLKRGCESIDLNMLDHIIITSDGFYSYRDEGRL